MDPVEALRRIAYLLERDGAESYKVRAFRTRPRPSPSVPPDELAAMAPASAAADPRRGKDQRPGDHRGGRGSHPGVSARSSKRSTHRPSSDEAVGVARAVAGRLPQSLGLVGRREPDPRDGRGGSGARAPLLGADRPQSPTRPSPTGSMPNRLRQQLDVVGELERRARTVPHPDRHRGRHPRGRFTRSGRRSCWRSSTSSWPASIRSCGWTSRR